MTSPLDQLRVELDRSFAQPHVNVERWSDLPRMGRARAQVEREHGSALFEFDPGAILSVLSLFRRSRRILRFRDLKYICFGLTIFDERGYSIVGDPYLRAVALEAAERIGERRRQLRCFQALLSAYWMFPLHTKEANEDALAGWLELRGWLGRRLQELESCEEAKLPWFQYLLGNSELVSNNPCKKIGAALLRGDSSLLNETVDVLAIPKDSWLMDEALLAQINASCEQSDTEFRNRVSDLLPLLTGKRSLDAHTQLRIKCVSRLLSRYARCAEQPEHMALRDIAVAVIGNPWVRRVNWDAWVVDGNGAPDSAAREMVNGWLKRRLILDFFTLLSSEGTGDQRRVDYWLRFEPLIDKMWFALGPDAANRGDDKFRDFKARARGLLLILEGSTIDNNAFVMEINSFLAVDFGSAGNAFYLFSRDEIDRKLDAALSSDSSRVPVNVDWLKSQNFEYRGIHRDSATATWEQKFDAQLCPLLGQPSDSPSTKGGRRASRRPVVVKRSAPAVAQQRLPKIDKPNSLKISSDDLSRFLRRHGLRSEFRPGGALWIVGDSVSPEAVAQLNLWGFKFRAPRGWYRE